MSKKEVSQSNNEVKGDLAGNDVNKPTYNIGRTSIGGKSQLEKLYDRLEKERESSIIFSDIVDDLLHYKKMQMKQNLLVLK